MSNAYILVASCNNQPGIIFNVTKVILDVGGNITESRQFDDDETGRFFLRICFKSGATSRQIVDTLALIVATFGIEFRLLPADGRVKTLILVSKFDHCLAYLLYKVRMGELPMDIVAIASNHPRETLIASDLGPIPFHHLPIGADGKAAQEAEIKRLVERTGAELVVLARYMQILSDDLAAYLARRCINIHHSFLPSFKGAKPYHQAYGRGVKMIGATAHYVTADLDEGPIIYQAAEPVSHEDTPDDLIRKGREIESRVLGRAIGCHVTHRVIINGAKTVVFGQ